MSLFQYKAKIESGKYLYGIQEGVNAQDVKTKLRKTSLYFISARRFSSAKLFHTKVTLQELIMFTHRISTLIDAGVPILKSMNILWRQTESPSLQMVVCHMRNRLEEGRNISSTMDEFLLIFPAVYRALIRVGEKSGALTTVFEKLTEYLEYKAQLRTKVMKTLLYPSIVVALSFCVVTAMYIFVVPIFEKLLLKLKVELPFLTSSIISVSKTLRSPLFLLIVSVLGVAGVVAYKQLSRWPRFLEWRDTLFMKIPFFGKIFITLSLSQFVRSLSILLGSGVPIVESIEVARTTVANRKLMGDFQQAQKDIEQGSSIYDAFSKLSGTPILLNEMVGVGETSGMVVKVLEKLNQHFDAEVDYELNKFLTYLEPILILIVGVIVILTLLSIYLPVVTIWEGILGYY